MQRRAAWILGFVLGLVGGSALATGVYTATAGNVDGGSPSAERATVYGGARPASVNTRQAPPPAGQWIVTGSGAVTWVTTDEAVPSGGRSPDAAWYAERARQIGDVRRDIECQINGCTQVEDGNQGY